MPSFEVKPQLLGTNPMPAKASKNSDNYGRLPEEGWVKLPKILECYPVSESSWWAGIAAGIYPKGEKISKRSTAWPVESIRQLIARVGGEGGVR